MHLRPRSYALTVALLAALPLSACGLSAEQEATLTAASQAVVSAEAAVASVEAEAQASVEAADARADEAEEQLAADRARAAAERAREAAAAASMEGRYQLTTSCDYLLDFDNGHKFVGDAFLTNQGTTPITVEVTAKWLQAGGEPIVETRSVPLAGGEEDVQVAFSQPASREQISAIQALPSGNQCSVDTDGEDVEP